MQHHTRCLANRDSYLVCVAVSCWPGFELKGCDWWIILVTVKYWFCEWFCKWFGLWFWPWFSPWFDLGTRQQSSSIKAYQNNVYNNLQIWMHSWKICWLYGTFSFQMCRIVTLFPRLHPRRITRRITRRIDIWLSLLLPTDPCSRRRSRDLVSHVTSTTIVQV